MHLKSMNRNLIKYFVFTLILGTNYIATAQNAGNSELDQIALSASNYLAKGDYDNAIMMYNQAIKIAPNNVVLRRDIAYTYFLKQDYKKAKEIITPVLNSEAADAQTYQVASAIENAEGYTNKAKRIINQGIKSFPQSGLLYNTKGNLLSVEKKTAKEALAAWNEGIAKDPSFPMNYFNAAKGYLSVDPIWSIIYAETFINLDGQSSRSLESRKILIEAYKQVFLQEDEKGLPKFNANNSKDQQKAAFSPTMKSTLQQHAATISDGFTTENLIMLRTRFALVWNAKYASTYNTSLYNYQAKLIKNGMFSAYNQWLIATVENPQQFSVWINQHKNEYSKFEIWRKNNPYFPTASDEKPN